MSTAASIKTEEDEEERQEGGEKELTKERNERQTDRLTENPTHSSQSVSVLLVLLPLETLLQQTEVREENSFYNL